MKINFKFWKKEKHEPDLYGRKVTEYGSISLRKYLDFIAKCEKCDGVFILPDDGGWVCPHCNHYEGNAGFTIIYDPWSPLNKRKI